MNGPEIYLASSSPRRQQLLAQIGVRFEILQIEVQEQQLADETPMEFVRRMALEKARAGWELTKDTSRPVLGADTAVILDGEVLGKPSGRQQGLAMLERLSGRRHEVFSGVALVAAREDVKLQVSHVTFRELTQAERIAYWDTSEPEDKAGGYGIQGLAAIFIAKLEGSYSGVMGLPLYETASLLEKVGVDILDIANPAKV